MVKKVTDVLFNVFYYKVALMFFLIPTLLVYCVSYNYKVLSVMMYWGALVCAYDLFVRRNFVKTRGMLWLLGFLAVFLLSVFLNISRGFSYNITSWAYTVIALFLLYPDGTHKERAVVLKELSVINTVYIAMTAVLSTVSLGMFVCLYGESIVIGTQTYTVGWMRNRLFGVYFSTGYMITAIGLAVILLQVAVLKARNGKLKKRHIVFLAYTAVTNFLSMCMENAKGSFFSLAAFAAFAAFFFVLRRLLAKGRRAVLSTVAAVLAAVLTAGGLLGVIYAVRPALAYVPSLYQAAGGKLYTAETAPTEDGEESPADTPTDTETEGTPTDTEQETPTNPETEAPTDPETEETPAAPTPQKNESSALEGVEIDRDIDASYGFFTGRPQIWKFGWEEFLKQPVFGYGPQSHRNEFVVDGYLRHFHNLIIQTMVSVGTVGSVLIFGFFLTVFFFLLKKLVVRMKANDPCFAVALLLLAILGMLIVNSMSEVTILFLTRFSMFLFWIYLGYAVALLGDGEETRGVRFLKRIDARLGAKCKRIERK